MALSASYEIESNFQLPFAFITSKFTNVGYKNPEIHDSEQQKVYLQISWQMTQIHIPSTSTSADLERLDSPYIRKWRDNFRYYYVDICIHRKAGCFSFFSLVLR